jgi:hypothetical protein
MEAAPEKRDAPSIAAIGKWDSLSKQGGDVKEVAESYSSFFDRSKGEVCFFGLFTWRSDDA